MQIDIQPAERVGDHPRFLRPIHTALAFSPDGRNLVFSGVRGNQSQLYLRSLDQERAEAIPRTEAAQSPAFSPDRESILFWAGKVGNGEIKRVGLGGGPIMELYKFDTQPFGTGWLSDDMVVLGHPADRSENLAGIWRFAPQVPSGEILAAPEKDQEEWKYFTPKVLPGGREVLFLIKRHLRWAKGEQIVVRTLKTGEQKVLVENGTDPRYVPTGHLVYAETGRLMAAPFDLDKLELTGPSVPVVEDLMHIYGRGVLGEGAAEYTFSRTGSLAYVRAEVGVERLAGSLVWVDRKGATERLQMPTSTTEGETGFLKWFRLSPDGSRVVGVDVDRDVAVLDLRRSTLTRLTLEGDNVHPSWSSDGKKVLFSSRRRGDKNNLFYEQVADGSEPAEEFGLGLGWASSRSADGRIRAFVRPGGLETRRNIWILETGAEAKPFLQSRYEETWPAFSPDGGWLAYGSNESGRHEVYVQSYPKREKHVISTHGGREPVWSRDGRELFYLRPQDQSGGDRATMMFVSVETSPGFRVSRPRKLFQIRTKFSNSGRGYDVSPDGQRFLMFRVEDPPNPPPAKIQIVLNWFEELKRLAPTN